MSREEFQSMANGDESNMDTFSGVVHPTEDNQHTDNGGQSVVMQAIESLETALATQKIVWLHAPSHISAPILAALKVRLETAGGCCIVAGSPTAECSAFGPIRTLIEQFIPYVRQYAPDLIAACASELQSLVPRLASELDIGDAPPLESLVPLPLGLARMLPRESEYVLRLATRIGWLITTVCRSMTTVQKDQPLFVFQSLDTADHPSLLTISHLCLRTGSGPFRLVLASEWSPDRAVIRERDGLFDRQYERELLLRRICQQTIPTVTSQPIPTTSVASQPPLLGEDEEALAHRAARSALQASSVDDRWAAVSRAFALSARYSNSAPIFTLAEQVITSGILDQVLVQAAWQSAGIAHASLGNFLQAQTCFQHAFDLGDDRVVRARMAMFLALVLAKRIQHFDQAQQFIDTGYQALENLETPEAMLERGWLSNVQALIAYRRRDYKQALRLTQEAIQFLKPYRGEEAVGLKTNLVTNMSILFEDIGEYQRALNVWHLFQTFLGDDNALFAKHYLFREAGLTLKAGQEAEASALYQHTFTAAARVGDLITLEATARASLILAYRTGDYQVALSWAERIPSLLEQLGDQQSLWRGWMVLAACQASIADVGTVAATLQQAVETLEATHETDQLTSVKEILDRVQAGHGEQIEWSAWLPALPGTSIRWPLRLVLP
jgi:tetratricopeptide (TPR) repeat protein